MVDHLQRECPVCGGPVRRVHRRMVDRLLSMVVPVHRFQCKAVDCAWRGNLRVGHSPFTKHVPQK